MPGRNGVVKRLEAGDPRVREVGRICGDVWSCEAKRRNELISEGEGLEWDRADLGAEVLDSQFWRGESVNIGRRLGGFGSLVGME